MSETRAFSHRRLVPARLKSRAASPVASGAIAPMLRGLLTLSPLTLLTVLTAIVQGKALALLLGPAGTGVVALAASVLTLGSAVAGLGVSSAVMKVIAEASSDDARAWQTYLLGLLTVTGTGVIVATAMFLGANLVSQHLLTGASLTSGDRRLIVASVAIGIIPSVWCAATDGALRGLQTLRRYVLAGSLNTLLALTCVVGLASIMGTPGAIIGLVAAQVLGAVVLFAFVTSYVRRRGARLHLLVQRATAPLVLRRLLMLGCFALVAGVASTVGQAGLRLAIAHSFDLRALGYFAGAWAITNRIPTLVYRTFAIYAIPRLSSLGSDWRLISHEQNEAMRLSLSIMAPVLCCAIAASRWIVILLLSRAFLPGAKLLEIMFLGELLSVVYWTLSIALFSTGRAVRFATAEWGLWLVFLGCTAGFTPVVGLRGVAIAYVVAQGAMVAALYVWEKKHHGFSWTRSNVRLLTSSLLALGVVLLTTGVSTPLRIGVAAIVLSVWAFVGLSSQDRESVVRLAARMGR